MKKNAIKLISGIEKINLYCTFLLQQFKNEVEARLSDLECLNRDYRQLAREGRTDAHTAVKRRTQELNQRWDELSQRSVAVLRRLR